MLEKGQALSGTDGPRLGFLAAGIFLLGGLAGLGHAQTTTLSPQAQVGQQLFFDTHLSGSKKLSCATCHDPTNHYAQPTTNTHPVQYGGPNLTSPGFRAVPTLTYKLYNPPYIQAIQQAHPASVMCSYGSVNGVNDCADPTVYTDWSKAVAGV